MIDFRDATAADGPAVAAMAAKSFTDTFGHLYRPQDLASFLTDTFGPDGLPREIGDPKLKVRIALDGDRIVGFAKIAWASTLPAPATPADGELWQLYVASDYHGAGIAAGLMDWAMAELRAAGPPRIVLSVWCDNIRAQRFYARYGFAEIGSAPFRVGEQLDDDRIWSVTL